MPPSHWLSWKMKPSTSVESCCLLCLPWLPCIHSFQLLCLYQLNLLGKKRHIGMNTVDPISSWTQIWGWYGSSFKSPTLNGVAQHLASLHTPDASGDPKTAKQVKNKWDRMSTQIALSDVQAGPGLGSALACSGWALLVNNKYYIIINNFFINITLSYSTSSGSSDSSAPSVSSMFPLSTEMISCRN